MKAACTFSAFRSYCGSADCRSTGRPGLDRCASCTKSSPAASSTSPPRGIPTSQINANRFLRYRW